MGAVRATTAQTIMPRLRRMRGGDGQCLRRVDRTPRTACPRWRRRSRLFQTQKSVYFHRSNPWRLLRTWATMVGAARHRNEIRAIFVFIFSLVMHVARFVRTGCVHRKEGACPWCTDLASTGASILASSSHHPRASFSSFLPLASHGCPPCPLPAVRPGRCLLHEYLCHMYVYLYVGYHARILVLRVSMMMA